jgi:hypothetical protein
LLEAGIVVARQGSYADLRIYRHEHTIALHPHLRFGLKLNYYRIP